MIMRRLLFVAVALALLVPAGAPAPAAAQDELPDLFVNLTSADAWRAGMALAFARRVQDRGHAVTVFLNVDAVRIASTEIPSPTNAATGETLQDMLAGIVENEGAVIVCPMCMDLAGITEAELIDGAQVGGADVTFPALFGDNVRVMSY
jgi:predicted peroxiredoxin